MTLGDSGRITRDTLQCRSTDEAIKSIHQIHRFEIKFGILDKPCQARNRHISDNRRFLLFSSIPFNLRSRCNRCDYYDSVFGFFDRLTLRG